MGMKRTDKKKITGKHKAKVQDKTNLKRNNTKKNKQKRKNIGQ